MPISNGEVEDLLAEGPDAEATEGEPTDAIAVAAAAVSSLDEAAEPALDASADGEAALADVEAAPEEPRRRNVFSRIFGPRKAPEAEATDAASADLAVEPLIEADGPPAALPTPAPAEVVATLANTAPTVAVPATASVGALTETDVAPEFGTDAPEATSASDQGAPRKGFLRRLFGPRNPDVSRTDAGGDALSIDATAEAPIAASAAAPTIQATSLDSGPEAAAPVQVASTAPLDRSVAGLDDKWVQIGLFNEESRARSAAGDLRAAGVIGTIRQETVRGQTVWRVVVGPASSNRDRQAIIRKAQEIGYTDAFAISG
nr:SPOR domain-containing protein [Jannaschia pohangensis]